MDEVRRVPSRCTCISGTGGKRVGLLSGERDHILPERQGRYSSGFCWLAASATLSIGQLASPNVSEDKMEALYDVLLYAGQLTSPPPENPALLAGFCIFEAVRLCLLKDLDARGFLSILQRFDV